MHGEEKRLDFVGWKMNKLQVGEWHGFVPRTPSVGVAAEFSSSHGLEYCFARLVL